MQFLLLCITRWTEPAFSREMLRRFGLTVRIESQPKLAGRLKTVLGRLEMTRNLQVLVDGFLCLVQQGFEELATQGLSKYLVGIERLTRGQSRNGQRKNEKSRYAKNPHTRHSSPCRTPGQAVREGQRGSTVTVSNSL